MNRQVRVSVVVGAVAILREGIHWAARLVHRQLVMVDTKTVAVRISVGEHTSQQHLIRGEADTRDRIRRCESGLLNLGEEVARIAVQGEVTDRNQRVVLLRPGLGQVERVHLVAGSLVVRHDLHLDVPGWVVAALNCLEKILASVVGVFANQLGGLIIRQEVPALASLKVVLNPETLPFSVNPLIGVRTEAVHMTEVLRNTTVTHQVSDLVSGLRRGSPEIPLHIGIAQARIRQALLRVDEVRELNAIADEEHRRVVAHDVEVALFGVELQRKTAHVTPAIRGALLTSDSGESCQHRRDNVRLEDGSLSVLGDVLSDGQLTESTCALSVNNALRDALTVEVRQLFQQVDVVEVNTSLWAIG